MAQSCLRILMCCFSGTCEGNEEHGSDVAPQCIPTQEEQDVLHNRQTTMLMIQPNKVSFPGPNNGSSVRIWNKGTSCII